MCVRVGRGLCVLMGYNFMESVLMCWEGCVLGGECMCVGCVSVMERVIGYLPLKGFGRWGYMRVKSNFNFKTINNTCYQVENRLGAWS